MRLIICTRDTAEDPLHGLHFKGFVIFESHPSHFVVKQVEDKVGYRQKPKLPLFDRSVLPKSSITRPCTFMEHFPSWSIFETVFHT